MSVINVQSDSSGDEKDFDSSTFSYGSYDTSAVKKESEENVLPMMRNNHETYLPSADSGDSEESENSPDILGRHNFNMGSTGKKRKQNFESDKEEKIASFDTNKASQSWNEAKIKKSCPGDVVSSKAELMMLKMGYKTGAGLGKFEQGIQEPVALSQQKGRRGLGLELKELKQVTFEFDPKEEIVTEYEEITWLDNKYYNTELRQIESLMIENSNEWMQLGKCADTIDNEIEFCDKHVVKGVVDSKSIFDRLDKNEMREARTRSNPYETMRNAIFLNRAAVKMANMDAVCKFMFTQPQNLPPHELLYFADVCAGPGGFSEYVLWRRKWYAKGFGFTLKKENDFKLDDFHSGPCETFHTYYGPRNDGDVYQTENQMAFRDLIMQQTKIGVHFMMSDGGFSVEGSENIQEILSKQLYLCQCLVALMIVRPGGNFVTKLFDLFTPFSAGLVYLMYRCFRRISIFKPVTSRPANSERYLICQGKLEDVSSVVDHLLAANKIILNCTRRRDNTKDVIELVPLETLQSDQIFFEYLKKSNEDLGAKQIIGLKKIAYYVENKNLFEVRQGEMREKCLKLWNLPWNKGRTLPHMMEPEQKFQNLIKKSMFLEKISFDKSNQMTKENISLIRKEKNEWFCMLCGSGEDKSKQGTEERAATLYLGLGRFRVYRFFRNRWQSITSIQLPPDTLVYAEMIEELRGEGQGQRKTYGLQILDACVLGGVDISEKFIVDRNQAIKVFCESLFNPSATCSTPVRVKELIPIDEFMQEKMMLQDKIMKNRISQQVHSPIINQNDYNDEREPFYYIPRSIMFLKATVEPWIRCKKVSSGPFQGRYFFFNTKENKSLWSDRVPVSAYTDFDKALQSRIVLQEHPLNIKEFLKCIQNDS